MKYPYLLLILMILLVFNPVSAENTGAVQIDADTPGVSVFLDGKYIGDSPRTLGGLTPGDHQIAATLSGFPSQVKNVTISSGTESLFFTFGVTIPDRAPGMIKISDCVGTPESAGLLGTAVNVIPLKDGSMMAYYTGRGNGVRCAGSENGTRWHEYPDGCLPDQQGADGDLMMVSNPWVIPLDNGDYRMFYMARNDASSGLMSAYSSDGLMFEPEGQVLLNKGVGALGEDIGRISVPSGVRLDDGTIRMYYGLEDGIHSATSPDEGLNWNEEDGIRISSATDPSVVVLSDGKTGIFYVDLSSGSKGQKVWFTVSDDGTDFSAADPITVVESGEQGVWILEPEIHVSPENRWDLYFSLMGSASTGGVLTVPVMMKTVIDPDCLITRIRTIVP
ncbi:MAG TPA: PEGA domain-containing protein [Methanospirillum sp.]|nr:PEGA domain-containing protein [Methanospirillum sp.]